MNIQLAAEPKLDKRNCTGVGSARGGDNAFTRRHQKVAPRVVSIELHDVHGALPGGLEEFSRPSWPPGACHSISMP
jgi:hypothetical protein